jgi:hypothetical protein
MPRRRRQLNMPIPKRSRKIIVNADDFGMSAEASLAGTISLVLQNVCNIRIMVDRAEGSVRAELTWKANARKTAEVYREALA